MNIKIKHVKLNIYKNYLREAKLSNILSQWDYGWQQSVFIIVSGWDDKGIQKNLET